MTLSEGEITTNNGNFLKKYKILGKIGEGSFSDVLKCQDRETGKLYAAKRLKHTKESIQQVLLTPEVIALRKLMNHRNILQMIESFFDPLPGKVTLVFELMDMSLYDLIKDRKRALPEIKMKIYLYQILKGVNHLNKHGLFHRDIKPENILIKISGEEEIIKLADLGSVRGIFCRPPLTEYISTRWYRSPECLLTKGFYGPKMDVWAIGCVYYEILMLKPLFPGANETDQIERIHSILGTPSRRIIEKFFKHKSRNYEVSFPQRVGIGLSTLMRGITEDGIDIVKRMLVYDPSTRSNIRRLLEHRYFEKLKIEEKNKIKDKDLFRNPEVNVKKSYQSTIKLNGHSPVYDVKCPESPPTFVSRIKNGNKIIQNNIKTNIPKINPVLNVPQPSPSSLFKSRKLYPVLSTGTLKTNSVNSKEVSNKLSKKSTGIIKLIKQPLQKPLNQTKFRPMDSELILPKVNKKAEGMSTKGPPEVKKDAPKRLPTLITSTSLKSKQLQHNQQHQYNTLPRIRQNYYY